MGLQFDHITKLRKLDPVFTYHFGAKVVNELEEAYGKYLHVPLDMPIIKPNDLEAFISWYNFNSKRAVKQVPNTANPDGVGNSHFRSIDGIPINGQIWTQNSRLDIWDVFPELREQIYEYFPITDLQNWRMWSSTMEIFEHRDDDPMVDFPIAWRVKLYDENPDETLFITLDEGQPTCDPRGTKLINRLPPDTNSWAWNNVRTYHGSSHNLKYYKILWIISSDNKMNLNKYIDLMDRSISKYKDYVYIDERPYTNYYSKAW